MRAGDELPYVPESTGNARVSFFRNDWSVEASLDFQSKCGVPGAGLINEDLHADDFTTIDLTVSYRASETLTWQLLLLMPSDEAAIVSHRPFGARPNRPRSLIGRVKYQF